MNFNTEYYTLRTSIINLCNNSPLPSVTKKDIVTEISAQLGAAANSEYKEELMAAAAKKAKLKAVEGVDNAKSEEATNDTVHDTDNNAGSSEGHNE